MRISDWSSDVCSSDLFGANASPGSALIAPSRRLTGQDVSLIKHLRGFPASGQQRLQFDPNAAYASSASRTPRQAQRWHNPPVPLPSTTMHRSEEHTSELQSLMRISYAVFCLKKKKHTHTPHNHPHHNN